MMKIIDIQIPEELQQKLIEKANCLNVTVESFILDSLERLVSDDDTTNVPLGKQIQTLEEIESQIRELKPSLQEQFHISEIGIFGSYVKGLQNSASDVDLLVEFSTTPSLLKLSRLQIFLCDCLGLKVDLVRKKNLREELRDKILAEVQYV